MKEILQGAEEWLSRGEDIGLSRHSDAVAWLAQRFARYIKMGSELAYITGRLHDLGKANNKVLFVLRIAQGRRLDWLERWVIRKHPQLGLAILERWEKNLECKVAIS